MKFTVLIVFLMCMMSFVVYAQDTLGHGFNKTLAKNFRIPRYGAPHNSFSIKFTTNKNTHISEIVLSDNTDSLLRAEFQRLRPLLNLKSLEGLLLPESEAVLSVILVHDSIEMKSKGIKLMSFNGVTAIGKKFQLLPPILMKSFTGISCGRGAETYAVKPLIPLVPLPIISHDP